MSKNLFLKIREAEIMTEKYFPNKKEIKLNAEKFASDLIDSGDINITETFAQALRLNEALTIITAKLKKAMPEENFEGFGLKGTFKGGGDTKNYDDCEVYAEIKKQLADRKALLDMALKTGTIFYDSEGIEVPKVSTTPRKSSLAITY